MKKREIPEGWTREAALRRLAEIHARMQGATEEEVAAALVESDAELAAEPIEPGPRWKAVLDALIAELTRVSEVERVILFGSRARGDARERSDIDIAVSAPGASPVAWDRVYELTEEAPTLLSIDVVRLDEAGGDLRDVIDREGVVLFERSRAA